jgi:hypothetical protein
MAKDKKAIEPDAKGAKTTRRVRATPDADVEEIGRAHV